MSCVSVSLWAPSKIRGLLRVNDTNTPCMEYVGQIHIPVPWVVADAMSLEINCHPGSLMKHFVLEDEQKDLWAEHVRFSTITNSLTEVGLFMLTEVKHRHVHFSLTNGQWFLWIPDEKNQGSPLTQVGL